MQQFAMTGEPPPPMPSRVSAWSVYDVFTLADGEQLFIGAVSDKQFLTLCRVIEAPELRGRSGAGQQRAARGGAARPCSRSSARSCSTTASKNSRPSSKPPAFPTRRSCGPTSWSTIRT